MYKIFTIRFQIAAVKALDKITTTFHFISESQLGGNETETENADVEESLTQFGSGASLRDNDTDFIEKVATLVSQRLQTHNPMSGARPVISGWTNYDLSPPSTSVIGNVNTTPPLRYDQKLKKNDSNDIFGIRF